MVEAPQETIKPFQVEEFSFRENELKELGTLPKIEINTRPHEVMIGDVEVFDKNPQTELSQKEIVNPSALLKWVREKAKDHNVSPWEITENLRLAGIDSQDFEKIYELENRYNETTVYVSDIHGGNEAIINQLGKFVKYPPEALIMTGDIVGTETFNTLQGFFYNDLNNRTKDLLKENPNATDKELLEYSWKNKARTDDGKEIDVDFNLRQGLHQIKKLELQLAGKTDLEIASYLDSLTDETTAQEIRGYLKYVHYGHYASDLPKDVKAGLIGGLEKNASELRNVLLAIQNKGTKVAIVEGNWDIRNPLDFESNTEKPVPVSGDKRVFNTEKYFSEAGISYFSKIGTIETAKTLQVLLPFDQITGYPNLSEEKKQEIKKQVTDAKINNKQIVFVAHGEPSFRAHNLNNDKQASGEHAQIVLGMQTILSEIQPDEIVYSHMHSKIERKDLPDVTNYSLKLNDGPEIPAAFTPFNNKDMIVSFGIKEVGKKSKNPAFKPTIISEKP